ncbi:MAG: hypothetical protein E7515_04910 [Ruminococcaceae bacterium]|nr:hypothetical protein [Oscillospiraceae bacterium]
MNRKIIAVICLMLAASFIFASCAKNTKKDKDGNEYIVYTDENGETVTDKEGSVVVVPTNYQGQPVTRANGELATQTIPVPAINVSQNGKKVDCKAYTLNIPDGWVLYTGIDDYAQLRKGDEDSDIKIDIRYYSEGYDEILKQAKEVKKSFVDNIEDVIVDEEEEITLKNGEISPVTKLSFLGKAEANGKEVTAGFVYYVFQAGGHTYAIPCAAQSEDGFKNTDFQSVIEAIEFKN